MKGFASSTSSAAIAWKRVLPRWRRRADWRYDGSRMQLKRHPFDLDVFAFGGLFQRRLRQEAPGSNVVGENQDRYRHSSRFYTHSYLKSACVILPGVSFSSLASRNPAKTIWRPMRLAVLDGEIVRPASAPPKISKRGYRDRCGRLIGSFSLRG